MKTAPCTRRLIRSGGFTMIELAVALAVIALLLAGMLVPLQKQVETAKLEETQRLLEQAAEALIGYAATNGYFPCPADATSNGQEAAGTNHNTGACGTWNGFLPAAALGLRPVDAQGYAVDGWGTSANRVRYAISSDTVGGVTNPFTRTNGFRSVPITSFGATPLLQVCQSGNGPNGANCGGAVPLASNAAVVLWSVGPNAATGGTSAHEAENPNPNGGSADRIFVSRTHSTSAGAEFDDVVAWIPVTTLLSRLVTAGQFTPAAQMAVSPPPANNKKGNKGNNSSSSS